ncbi:hypothetical protein Emag_003311 [Eimeria magna]
MAASTAPAGPRTANPANAVADVVPNPTLYCKNLNDRVQLSDLVACLYECFSAYGLVLDVVAGRKIRGQAFVVFSELSSATAALRGLQGKEFLGKPLHLSYAKTKSDAYLKHIDQYKPRKPHAPRTAVVATQAKVGSSLLPAVNSMAGAPPHAFSSTSTRGLYRGLCTFVDPPEAEKSGLAGASQYLCWAVRVQGGTPTEGKFSLFVENLPEKASKASLEILFSQYRGYADTRLVEGRGVAFVDFTTQPLAEVALQGLQGFKLTPRNPLRISHVDK